MVSATEKTTLHHALAEAFDSFIASISQFDDSEINHTPFEGSWTPAQVALHIIRATDGVPDQRTTAANRPTGDLLPMIRPWWEDVSQKFQSPDPLQPDDKPRSKQFLIDELNRVQKKDISILNKKDLSEICLAFELPAIGYLTRYEWLWFIEMHLKRHVYQLNNMKAKWQQIGGGRSLT